MTLRRLLSLLGMALLVSLLACATPTPASTPEECEPAVCPTEPVTEPPSETASRPSPSDMVPRITIDELRQKMETKADILLVDNRHKEEYDVDHIKGAVLAPLDAVVAGEWLPPPGKELILY